MLILLIFLGAVQGSAASSWGYVEPEGPSTWGSLDGDEVCGSGQRQSPIDLRFKKGKFAPPNSTFVDAIHFSTNWWDKIAEGELENNGHTVEFSVDLAEEEYIFYGGPFGNEQYQFDQLHFHWGSDDTKGSEHTIKGKQFPMEMHMVCINSKYIESNGTLNDEYLTAEDGVAVLGFMFSIGEKSYEPLEGIVDGISSIVNGVEDEDSTTLKLYLGSFLNSVMKGGYFSYLGSFTTPGCNEVVTWVFFKKPIKISKEQIEAYRALSDSHGAPLVDNFRPTQELNGRAIKRGKNVDWF